uniref:Chloride channel K n=1 Tax=Mastacembelus armatus TaxID=205130 RepID=A0A7N8WXD8_9TELE
MKNLDETPRSERNTENNCQEEENQLETSHNKSPLLSDSWKPYQRPRAIVKEWLLKLRCCLGAVCGMEWYGYAALGILTGFLSFLMDLSVSKLLRAHQWLYMKLEGHSLLQFLCWTLYPSCICVVGSSFSHSICPFSTGSGIPEVRAMLAGFEMPHYLSVTNLFTKYVGLICTLAAGSTIFLGKVGPFVHLSTMVGAYLSKLCSLVQTNKKVKPQYLFYFLNPKAYTMKQLLTSLLDGRQWTSESHNASVQVDPKPWLEWSSSGSSVYMTLTFFLLMKMWMLVLACTLPVPAGCFMPVFVYGAALGRLFGEGGAYVLSGLTSGQQWASINPGGYALAGAAAFSGAVTHTLSPALLAIELTGQFSHAVPALIATVLANARSRSGHRPSFYDAISISKRLPHLPSLKKACPW